MTTIEQLINLGVVLLLLCTIYFVQKLNRKLQILQAHKESFQIHLQKLIESLESVESHFDSLHKESRNLINHLSSRIQKAQAIRDDLDYFCQKAEKQADQISSLMSSNQETPYLNDAFPKKNGTPESPDTNKAALMRLLKRMK